MKINKTDEGNTDIQVTCSATPTQIEGTSYGHRVYFRERWGAWTFSVDGIVVVARGCEEFMPVEEALERVWKLIHKLFKEERKAIKEKTNGT